jgi:surfactin synthase thioesterase subunit
MRPNTWVRLLRAVPDARVRLFCLGHIGTGASLFSPWVTQGLPGVEICPLQLPGRENRLREPLLDRFSVAVSHLACGLGPHLDRPFALFGHCLGALLAFELARELRRRDPSSEPAALFLSCCRPPQARGGRGEVSHRSTDEVLVDEIRRLGGTSGEILSNTEMVRYLLRVVRADMALQDGYRYKPQPPLRCPLSVFGGRQDAEVSQEELAEWGGHTANVFTLRMIPGDHFLPQSAQGALLSAIQADLFGATCGSNGRSHDAP